MVKFVFEIGGKVKFEAKKDSFNYINPLKAVHENSHFPGKVKKNQQESDMLIGSSRRKNVLSFIAVCC
jgi:hypothetical protein